MNFNNAIQIIERMNVKTKDGYLIYNGMLIGETYLQAISEDSFMCDIFDKRRISTIDELEEELSKAIKLVKNFELDKKLDKLSEDF
jgi:hypothetical protein